VTVLTLAECARRITACRTAELNAKDDGDELSADAAHDLVDELLDLWPSL
jgi:hypothetical protein